MQRHLAVNNGVPAILTETPWEERNLGIKSFALNDECLATLTQEKLADELTRLKEQFGQFFIFARLPKSRLHLAPCLQNCGFYLVEGAVCPVIQFNKSRFMQEFNTNAAGFIPARSKSSNVCFTTLDNAHEKPVETLLSIARESFSTDRFHMDFRCPEESANRRFGLWINDLLNNKQVSFDMLEVNGEASGFMAREENHLIIAGFSRKYLRAGLGDYLWLGSLQRMQEQGQKYAETLVSINNIPSLNLHARLGFKFRDPQYSFHCWQE